MRFSTLLLMLSPFIAHGRTKTKQDVIFQSDDPFTFDSRSRDGFTALLGSKGVGVNPAKSLLMFLLACRSGSRGLHHAGRIVNSIGPCLAPPHCKSNAIAFNSNSFGSHGVLSQSFAHRARICMNAAAEGDSPFDDMEDMQADGKLGDLTELTSADEYQAAVDKAMQEDKPAVFKFHAHWCASCKAVAPRFKRLAAEYPDVQFYELLHEDNKKFFKKKGVEKLPFVEVISGKQGLIDSFSCGKSKLPKLHDLLCEGIQGGDSVPPEA
jgi:thiol-disulfide isomerase/thioredoxin